MILRMGLDVDTIAELNDGVSREYVIMSTEAASLHTDREVGQRTNLERSHDWWKPHTGRLRYDLIRFQY